MKSVLLCAVLMLSSLPPATAQTDPGSPVLTPLTPLPDVAKPLPHAGRAKTPLAAKPPSLPKPTKEDLAEQRKLAHDMRICIGC